MNLMQMNDYPSSIFNLSFSASRNLTLYGQLAPTILLCGQYTSDWHARNWSKDNPDGFCLLCPGRNIPGDIEHLLLDCEALEENRVKISQYWSMKSEDKPHLQQLLAAALSFSPQDHVQFLLDPSVIPSVISGCQKGLFSLDEIFPLTRTYCYAMHRRRLQLLGRFKIV